VGGTTVNLGSGIQPVGTITSPLNVPPTITIPAGKGCLSIAVDADEVHSDVPVIVTASYRGVNLSATTIVRDFAGPPPPTSTATATATNTEVPTATATATNTEVPTETATATATETATETATNTPEPTATNTEVPATGCATLNDPTYDGLYNGNTVTGTFTGGEVLTFVASAPSTGSPSLMDLHIDFSTVDSGTFPDTLTYVVPSTGSLTVTWHEFGSFGSATVTWAVSCAAPV
jgi:hypothetical protein